MGVGGKGKNFFSREKKPKRRLRYIFVSSLSTVALCEGGSLFQKSGVFCKVESSPCWRSSTRTGNRAFQKSGVSVKIEYFLPLFRIGAVPHRTVVGIVADHRFQPPEKFYHVNNAARSKPERTGNAQYQNDIEFPLPQKFPTLL